MARAAEQRNLRPVQADRRRQILAGKAGAPSRVAGMAEVGVPVDVDQAVTPQTSQREADTEQQTAVAAQDEWVPTGLEQRIQSISQPGRVVEDGVLVAQPARHRVVDV